MINYEKLYFELEAKLADTIEVLDTLSETLKKTQQQNENDILEEK